VAVVRLASRNRSSELAVVASPAFRVAEDVPGLVDADHLGDVATEVRMMLPCELAISAADRCDVGFGIDTQNGVQGRQWTILQSAGLRSSDGVEKSSAHRTWSPLTGLVDFPHCPPVGRVITSSA
jgi:hypothetical protein